MLNFFLHTSQKEKYDDLAPLDERVRFYHPGGLEIRQFKNSKGIYFKLDQISRVLPYGLKNKPLLDYPIIKHYVERSIRQKVNRPNNGFQSNKENTFFKTDIELIKKNLFKEKLDYYYKQTRIYNGSLDEFEPTKRPSFFLQWLAWRKYREIDWGIFGLLIPSKHNYYKAKIFK